MENDQLSKEVIEWLETQGYPLEMLLAKTISSKTSDIIQPYYYTDPETNVLRETDLVARFTDDIGLLQLLFVFECKKLKKPWIIFSSDTLAINRINSFAFINETTRSVLIEHISELIELSWFKKPERLGYSVTQAFTTGDDQCYKALMSATKGAFATYHEQSSGIPFLFVFPVILFDGNLFESYIDSTEEIKAIKIETGMVHSNIHISGSSSPTVKIITRSTIYNLVNEIESMINFFKKILDKELKHEKGKLLS